jgi:hypothetical protein
MACLLQEKLVAFWIVIIKCCREVGPCNHGIVRPQFADGGTASSMEGSCEYIEQAVADNRQRVVRQLEVWAR